MSIAEVYFTEAIYSAQRKIDRRTGYLIPVSKITHRQKQLLTEFLKGSGANKAIFLGYFKDNTGHKFMCLNRAPVLQQRRALKKKGIDLNSVFVP